MCRLASLPARQWDHIENIKYSHTQTYALHVQRAEHHHHSRSSMEHKFTICYRRVRDICDYSIRGRGGALRDAMAGDAVTAILLAVLHVLPVFCFHVFRFDFLLFDRFCGIT